MELDDELVEDLDDVGEAQQLCPEAVIIKPDFSKYQVVVSNYNGALWPEATRKAFRPDLEAPTDEDILSALEYLNLMPVPYIEAADVSNAVLFLASEEARYITGIALPVDAGALIK